MLDGRAVGLHQAQVAGLLRELEIGVQFAADHAHFTVVSRGVDQQNLTGMEHRKSPGNGNLKFGEVRGTVCDIPTSQVLSDDSSVPELDPVVPMRGCVTDAGAVVG